MNSAPRPTANYLGAYREQLITTGIPDDLADRIVFDLATRLHEQCDVCIADSDAEVDDALAFLSDALDEIATTD